MRSPKSLLSSLACAALFCVFAAPVLHGDVIHFKDGRKMEGKIVEENPEWIRVKTPYGDITIKRKRILKIEIKATEEDFYLERLENLDRNDPDALIELALWCKTHKKKKEYREYLDAALKADDQHDGANREAGNVEYDGRWFTPEKLEEYKKSEEGRMRAKGMVKFEGEWITEAQRRKRLDLVEWEGEWITRMAQYHKLAERDIPEYLGKKMDIVDTEHLSLRVRYSEDWHEEALSACEEGIEHFLRTFEPDERERKSILRYPIPVYILEDLEICERFVKSGYIERYDPPEKDLARYKPETNFGLYFPEPLIVLTKGEHLINDDPSVSQAGFLAHHLGHLLIRRFKRGGKVPGWIESGMAHYYEGLVNDYQTLSICGFDEAGGVYRWNKGWENFLRWKRNLVGGEYMKELPTVQELFGCRIESMSAMEMAKAWSLTDYLLKNHREQFVRFIRHALAPYRGDSALSQEASWELAFTDTTPDDIEQAWRAWIVEQPVLFYGEGEIGLGINSPRSGF